MFPNLTCQRIMLCLKRIFEFATLTPILNLTLNQPKVNLPSKAWCFFVAFINATCVYWGRDSTAKPFAIRRIAGAPRGGVVLRAHG